MHFPADVPAAGQSAPAPQTTLAKIAHEQSFVRPKTTGDRAEVPIVPGQQGGTDQRTLPAHPLVFTKVRINYFSPERPLQMGSQ